MADSRQVTVDTPNDMNIREDQMNVRKRLGEQIARDKMVEEPPVCFNESFIFRLRQYKNTSFSGLWELVAIDKRGAVVEVITDADALPHALEAISNIMANKGF